MRDNTISVAQSDEESVRMATRIVQLGVDRGDRAEQQ
jgi:hypothetical protein